MAFNPKQNAFLHALAAQKAGGQKTVHEFDPGKTLQAPRKVKFPKLQQALTVPSIKPVKKIGSI